MSVDGSKWDVVSSSATMRLIYFRGHKLCQKSAMITKTVRGCLVDGKERDVSSSMSGPHHYFGYLDPLERHTIRIDEETHLPKYIRHLANAPYIPQPALRDIDSEYPLRMYRRCADYQWISGREMIAEDITTYGLNYRDEDETVLDSDSLSSPLLLSKSRMSTNSIHQSRYISNAVSTDSLFAYPGDLRLKTLLSVGMHAMAMTGNHHAMATADTVFIKNRDDATNVRIVATPREMSDKKTSSSLDVGDDEDVNAETLIHTESKCLTIDENGGTLISSDPGLLLTSNCTTLANLRTKDAILKRDISARVQQRDSLTNPFQMLRAYWWNLVIYTPSPQANVGWEKTLGTALP